MSKLEVNAVEPQCGTNLTLGASGDTIIIPSGATISNQGTAAGFGPTGAVSWNTTKITADPNPAVSGVGYFADTTSAAFTITLPSSPTAGAVIGIADYANTFATNNVTIDRNGSNIGGSAINAVLSTNGVSVTLVYVDATQGWIITDSGSRSDIPQPTFIVATGGTVTCCGDYKIHTFTGPGTFTVCSVGNPLGSDSVDYLVVAGGGGGGWEVGGGGGAGGYRESSGAASGCYSASPLGSGVSALPVSAQGYPISIGAGGSGGTGSGPAAPGNGTPTTALGLTSTGGGGGGNYQPGPQVGSSGSNGGSGGGAGGLNPGGSAGTGNSPPVAPPQGNNGGILTAPAQSGGGGGGATATGSNSVPNPVGGFTPRAAGGTTSISGSSLTYAQGGRGATDGAACEQAGGANTGTGGDGDGTNPNVGGAGGSGIVIIRYKYQ